MSICSICDSKQFKYFYKLNNYTYYLCLQCNTLFLYPQPNTHKLETYYRESFQYSATIHQQRQIKDRAQKIIKKLQKLNPSGSTLLDIGSGYGFFLEELKKTSIQGEGIEPSKELFSNSVKNKLTVYNVLLKDFETKEKYDYITLIHVIEHVRNPQLMLKKIKSLLKPNGYVYIETPNLDSHLFNAEKTHYTFLTPPDHTRIFSLDSFNYLMRRISNLLIEDISSYSDSTHFMGIAKAILGKKQTARLCNRAPKTFDPPVLKDRKTLLIDDVIAPVFTPLLNLGNKGSILELYIKKT